MVDARTATAADFDAAAQGKANASWFWLIVTAAIGYFFHWWAILPGLLLLLSIVQCISATRYGEKLRKGTYPIPNPNNGAPDGDARNDAPGGST